MAIGKSNTKYKKFNAEDRKIVNRLVERDRQLKDLIKLKERQLKLWQNKLHSSLMTYDVNIIKKRRLNVLKLTNKIKFLKSLTL